MTFERDGLRVEPYGDAGVLVTLGDSIDHAVSARVRAVLRRYDALVAADPRFGVAVPAYASLLVPIDPLELPLDEAIETLAEIAWGARHEEASDEGRLHEVQVRYGGPDGPDLGEVAAAHALTEDQVVELHAATTYAVHFLGFAPGFAYLGPVAEAIATPRRATPRTRVPAGSVGIAGSQTGIYPFAMPGGWLLIGRTDVRLWDPAASPPARLAPGDRVRFVPVPAR